MSVAAGLHRQPPPATLWEQLRHELEVELGDVPIQWRHLLFPTARDDHR